MCLVCLVVVGPLLPWGTLRAWRAEGVALDVVVGLGVLWVLQAVGGAWARPVRWTGSWRSWLLGAGWSLLVTYELGRLASRSATNEDLPIYDLILLSRHLYILTRDLYGAWAQVAVVVTLCVPVVLWGVGSLAFGRLEAAARGLGPRRSGRLLGVVGVLGALAWGLPASRFVTPDLWANASESVGLALEVRQDIATRPQQDLVGVQLARRPDVIVYIIESYGDVVDHDPLRSRWEPTVDALDEHLRAHGWSTASARSLAPVHGGRSWISDASLLSGLHVARQATYEHVISMADRLDHFPSLFAAQGYTTVLVRPKDRARPGVELVNYFGFERTVFHDDLGYSGPIVGWGEVPDQYTVDWVHEHVLDDVEGPVFAFFHLATAHMPWQQAPPILDDYREWQARPGRTTSVFKERSFDSERAMRISRFKRKYRQPDEEPEVDEAQAQRYLDNVLYDLEVITRRHEGGPDGDQIVLVLGDHQPPMVARGTGMEVPVHVLASDPALLEGFFAAGFEDGLRPHGDVDAQVEQRELLAVVLRALAP